MQCQCIWIWVWWMFSCMSVHCISLPHSELVALKSLYDSTNGYNWTWENTSTSGPIWNFTEIYSRGVDPCNDNGQSWQKLTCTLSPEECTSNTTCSIASLYIVGDNLVGQLPSSIGLLSQCTYLNFAINFITGSLPSSIGNITTLRRLVISQNYLSNTLPSSFASLVRLSDFDVAINLLTGSVPNIIHHWSKLETFDISQNLFSGYVPANIVYLSDLKYLHIDYNLLSGPLPHNIGNMSVLRTMRAEENMFTGVIPTSVGQLTELIRLHVDHNTLCGTIPFEIGQLKEKLVILYVHENSLTGTLPESIWSLSKLQFLQYSSNLITGTLSLNIGYITTMLFFNASNNLLTGSVPSSIVDLSQMQSFELTNNYMTGSIPSDIGRLHSKLKYLFLDDNLLTGNIPTSVGSLSELLHFDISENYFDGTIPSTVGSMSSLRYFKVAENDLHGKLPQEIGDIRNLQELHVSGNFMSGHIPDSVGNLLELRSLQLSRNFISGSLPLSLGSLTNLLVFQVSSNALKGQLKNMLWQASNMSLINLDLSSNVLTGQIPPQLFQILTLQTVALSSNCLHGELPDTICHPLMKVLSMDGVGADLKCKGRFNIPFSAVGIPTTTGLSGTIPSCLFNMPELIVLHLAANGLSGSLRADTVQPSLTNISFAHNKLTGTIPAALKRKTFDELDLSYNKINGDCANVMIYGTNSTSLTLKVNRLSGAISRPMVRAKGVDVLSGNLFSCAQELPSHDPNIHEYVCGSTELDQSLYVLAISGGVIVLSFGIYLHQRYAKSGKKRTYTIDANAYLGDTSVTSSQESVSRLSISSLYVYVFFLDYISKDSFPHLRQFLHMLHLLLCNVICIPILAIIFCLPIYIIKFMESGSTEAIYVTHMHTYRWIFSAAYISGHLPAAFLLVTWALLLSMIIYTMQSFVMKYGKDVSRSSVLSSNGSRDASRSFSFSGSIQWKAYRSKLRVCSLIMLNIVTVSLVNGLYVYSTIADLSASVHLAIQLSVAVFKILWNFGYIPVLLQKSSKVVETRAKIKLFALMFNSIIVPCLVTVVTSPVCMQGIFVLPDKIRSAYSYSECDVFSLTHAGECLHYTNVVVDVSAFYPPFNYNYLCSSVLLSAYVPVYIYTYSMLLLSPILFRVLVRYIDYRQLPHTLRVAFPGVIWPYVWSVGNGKDKINNEGNDSKESRTYKLTSYQQLIKIDSIVGALMHHTSVLLTFGVCCIPLAFAISLTICLTALQWRILINRFLFIRLRLLGMWGNAARKVVISDILNFLQVAQPLGSNQLHRPSIGTLEASDSGLEFIEAAVSRCHLSMSQCLWPVVSITSIFYALLCWDIAGDKAGWLQSIWVPIVVLSWPVMLYHIYNVLQEWVYRRKRIPEDRNIDIELTSVKYSSDHGGNMTRKVDDACSVNQAASPLHEGSYEHRGDQDLK